MQNFTKQNWFKIVILIVFAFLLYWFTVRQDIIAKECGGKALEKTNEAKEERDISYADADEIYRFWFRECQNKRVFY